MDHHTTVKTSEPALMNLLDLSIRSPSFLQSMPLSEHSTTACMRSTYYDLLSEALAISEAFERSLREEMGQEAWSESFTANNAHLQYDRKQ